MNYEVNREALEATFNELTHLLIVPGRLTLQEAKLGDGGFGEVCLATLDEASRNPRKVAVKELRIPLVVRERIAFRLARELKVWAKAKHPNILELLGYHLSGDYGCAQLVSEFMANGDVMQYIQKNHVSAAVRLKFVRDIAAGLNYLHDFSPPICHGDLKPANILVNESIDAVLCDFGLSSFIHESGAASGLTTSRSIKGSPRYMSPELLLEVQLKHTLQSDVWAWGCTAFEIMTETVPYSTRRQNSAIILDVYNKSIPGSIDTLGNLILSTAVHPACHVGVSMLQSIIPQCWDFDPTRRPSSSIIFQKIAVNFPNETRLGVWEDQNACTSSLSIGGDSRIGDSTSQRPAISYPVHSIALQTPVTRLCKRCGTVPAVGTYDYCSRKCGKEAAKADRGGASSYSPAVVLGKPLQFFNDVEIVYPEDGPSPAVVTVCKNCASHPRSSGFEFCSRKCGQDYARAHQHAPPLPISKHASAGHKSRLPPDLMRAAPTRDSSSSSGVLVGGPLQFLRNIEFVYPEDGPSPAVVTVCKNCASRPRSSGFEFCSKKCGQDYTQAHQHATPLPISKHASAGHKSRLPPDLMQAAFTRDSSSASGAVVGNTWQFLRNIEFVDP